MGKRMITIKEFADKANLSEDHVRALLRGGKLKGVKAGREWRISSTEADSFLGINTAADYKRELYIKDLEGKVKSYEVQLCALKNVINSITEIVKSN